MSETLSRRRPASAMPSPRRIGDALRAIGEARERLLALDPEMPESDQKLYTDMLDAGSGDAFEVLDRVMRAAADAEDLAVLTDGRIKALKARKERFERRREALRETALIILTAMGIERVEREEYTASIGQSATHVIITDLNALPPEFVRITTTREADKAALLPVLRGGRRVNGAELSNATPVLRVRT